MTIARQFRSLGRPIQVLLINELTMGVSFYMLYPFLAVYFRDQLGFAAWTVGLILGIRTLSQQGMAIVGGSLADRFGYKPVLIAGLALRAGGFALFAVATTVSLVLAAAILSGLAGAVFGPATRAYYAVEAQGRRAEVFALASVFGETGTVIGPLVGLALLGISFQLVALVAAALFLGLMLLQVRYLPARVDRVDEAAPSVLRGWGEVLRNRPFLLFASVMLAQLTLYNQMYLGLPLEVERLTGSDAPVSALFIAASLLTIALQVPITSFVMGRWRPMHAISLGLLVEGLAFLPPLVGASLLPAGGGRDLGGPAALAIGALNLSPALLSAALLALGLLITRPFAMEMVPRLGRERYIGTYFGVYAMAAGIGATVGNTVTGIAFDVRDAIGLPGLPWLLMIAVGLGAGLAMRLLDRRGRAVESAVVRSAP